MIVKGRKGELLVSLAEQTITISVDLSSYREAEDRAKWALRNLRKRRLYEAGVVLLDDPDALDVTVRKID